MTVEPKHLGRIPNPDNIIIIVCAGCGKEFLDYKCNKRKFCSLECMYKHRDVVIKDSVKLQMTPKQQYYAKYGSEEGERHWNVFRENVSKNTPKDANTKWRFIAKYGQVEGEVRYSTYLENVKKWNNIQKTTTLEERLGKERAIEVHNKISAGGLKRRGENNSSFGIPRYPKLMFYPELGHSVRSSWELEIGNFLIKNTISYTYESQQFIIELDNHKLSYTPDFILSSTMIIEVKGMMYEAGFLKFIGFLEQYPTIITILIYESLPMKYIEKILTYKNVYGVKFSNYFERLLEIIRGNTTYQ